MKSAQNIVGFFVCFSVMRSICLFICIHTYMRTHIVAYTVNVCVYICLYFLRSPCFGGIEIQMKMWLAQMWRRERKDIFPSISLNKDFSLIWCSAITDNVYSLNRHLQKTAGYCLDTHLCVLCSPETVFFPLVPIQVIHNAFTLIMFQLI